MLLSSEEKVEEHTMNWFKDGCRLGCRIGCRFYNKRYFENRSVIKFMIIYTIKNN